MKKITLFILALVFLSGGFLIWDVLKKPSINAPKKADNSQLLVQKKNMKNSENLSKKILIIIASKEFKDEEYFETKQVLDNAGFNITVASNILGIAQGVSGGEVNVNLTTSNVDVNNYDAIVFIGGPGALQHIDNQDSYKIIYATLDSGKLLASICISPVILAKAGVLEGKKATVWTSSLDKSPAKILKEYGANYIDQSVVIDSNIITANGPLATKEFGEKIVKTLRNQ